MINNQKWSKLSFAEQLGHVGSEISRARHWHEKGDKPSRDKALERALELIDLTIDDKRWKEKLKEIVRLREIICDWLFEQKNYEIEPVALEHYCTDFLLAVK